MAPLHAEPHVVGESATVFVLADAGSAIQRFVDVFVTVYILLILAYVILSWFQLPYALSGVQRFLHDVCEPWLRLFRRIVPSLGPLDISPMIAVLALVVLQQVVGRVIDSLL